MTTIILQPAVPLPQPAPIRIQLPAAAARAGGSLVLVDTASGVRVPAQRDGSGAVVAVVGPISEQRRFRLESAPMSGAGVTFERIGSHRIAVKVDGQLLTEYHFDPANARPFFYPVIGPTGESVTRHYPMKAEVPGETRDHPHHRSMWSAYGELNDVDNWSESRNHGRQVPQGEPEIVGGPVFGRLTARNRWVTPDGKPQFDERRVLTVYNSGPDRRLFDYEITLTATEGDVRFGDTKEGGILSFRVASSMDAKDKGRIENSAGGVGEKECWGKEAAWCDYTGPVEGQTVGIGVMDHPGNFRSPAHWHVRDYGLMGTNYFGDSSFANERNGRRGEYLLKKGESLTFRYRVLLHRGNAAEGGVATAYTAYTQPPQVRIE
jgi:hypothetical protein